MSRETLNQLATLSGSKPSKSSAWETFKALVDDIERAYAVGNGGTIEDGAILKLSELYTFFKPAIPKNPKSKEQWVAKAMAGAKDVRYYLGYMYSDTERLIATDGHRLHLCKNYTIKGGFYDSEMNVCDVDANFPDVDRVIPDPEKIDCVGVVEIDNLIAVHYEDRKGLTEAFKFKEEHNLAFQGKYIREAISFMAEPTAYWDLENLYSSMIIIDAKNPDIQAVVMPTRL